MKINDLPKPILRQLSSAHGWLTLGNWEEAYSETEELPAEFKNHPLVLNFRVEIYRVGKAWALMADVARHLITLEPEEGGHWLNYSYGLRRAESVQAARDVLEKGKDLFPKVDLIWFNLACYCAQLGELDEARLHLAKAFELNCECRQAAEKDPDLEPLWVELKAGKF